MELSLFIADGYKGEIEDDEMLDDDLHQQDWLDGQ
jgi:hypothetical protein